jgi:hypothetical protein
MYRRDGLHFCSGRAVRLSQLAILAAAAVYAGMKAGLVARRLAAHAGPHARKRLAPGLGERFLANVAMRCAFACRRAGAGRAYRVLDTVFDLVLNGAIRRPAIGYVISLPVCARLYTCERGSGVSTVRPAPKKTPALLRRPARSFQGVRQA